jgi:hypothetical protein
MGRGCKGRGGKRREKWMRRVMGVEEKGEGIRTCGVRDDIGERRRCRRGHGDGGIRRVHRTQRVRERGVR